MAKKKDKVYLLVGCGRHRDKRIKFEPSDQVGPGSPRNDFDDGKLIRWDIDPAVGADVIHDLNNLPYPFQNASVNEIHAYETLEHCGSQGDGKFFFDQFQEFYRILKKGGYMCITVPIWHSEEAWGAPDHCRVFTPTMFMFLSKQYVESIHDKPMHGDYRRMLGDMDFQVCGTQEGTGHLGVVLRKM